MTPEEFEALTLKLANHHAKAMVTAFGPLFLHLVQQSKTEHYDTAWATLMNGIAACVASQVGSLAVSLGMNGKASREFTSLLLLHCTKATFELVERVRQGHNSGEVVVEYDATTDQPIPFDFRDHLKDAAQ